ncbi:MAG TPA: YlmC/YmxH family sporulation protein [Syntrophaceticus sp.]|uniref:Sporulation protein, YlmC/YmxH family n=1 Tax=Syntrophaceticus schinkii TaxID=499207 RepID=A0A0B7MGI7_9FIRM|nr:YlmC/YmxH family sporulation protein [Syntrophaceticus schinkii]HHY30408.1 YlmC/YmxH family sporulation protein [Syntrophaceticus sp.]MDD2359201.1 YlmC/YmxH family sporulation protein [Syntrophaceticus schinkii]MDD4260840.1 YlmC/YmxH family sporulation protein [Syntrophaceticus schinkii]MDD4675660.1 YlmC/YmxH family sporulation protein [Syntrophaceticus schinkii]CEO87328.1 Sporulation protein, YlmC/YmxH family [Syntrophaceticus schinkii]
MRLSDLAGKEIINIFDGVRLGTIGDSDMIIDPESGEVVSIILPGRSNFLNLWMDRQEIEIPWSSVKKVGSEVIIVDLDETYSQYKRYL